MKVFEIIETSKKELVDCFNKNYTDNSRSIHKAL
jgi:hypothetical protein